MAPHHDEPGRHGSHPLTEWTGEVDRPPFQEHMDRVEMDQNSTGGLGWKFDWSFNLGHLLSITAVIGSGFSLYLGIHDGIDMLGNRIEAVSTRVTIIEHGRSENLPRLEETIRGNAMQDQRIQNLAESVGRLGTAIGDLARIVTAQGELIHEAHERQAVLEERLGHGGPHDR